MNYETFKKIDKTALIEIVKKSISVSEVLKHLSLFRKGGRNHIYLKKLLDEYDIDYSHFKGKGWKSGVNLYSNIDTLKLILIKNKRLKRIQLLPAMLAYGFEYTCSCKDCNVNDTWLNKKIVLHIDHINGDNLDNRPENLRFLCPNCHSQTETYCTKKKSKISDDEIIFAIKNKKNCNQVLEFLNLKWGNANRINDLMNKNNLIFGQDIPEIQEIQIEKDNCPICGKLKDIKYKTCSESCSHKYQSKIDWNNINLLELTKTKSNVQIAKELGVSDVTVAKWIKKLKGMR